MAFDIEMIKAVYARLEDRVTEARKLTRKPLTASEKILYSHLWDVKSGRPYTRGADYVDFAPDRIACQDATAQMALLQFMQACCFELTSIVFLQGFLFRPRRGQNWATPQLLF